MHLHLRILDGVVAQGLAFRGAQVDEACEERVLRLFERRGLVSRETVAVMQGWGQWRFFCALGGAGRSAG